MFYQNKHDRQFFSKIYPPEQCVLDKPETAFTCGFLI